MPLCSHIIPPHFCINPCHLNTYTKWISLTNLASGGFSALQKVRTTKHTWTVSRRKTMTRQPHIPDVPVPRLNVNEIPRFTELEMEIVDMLFEENPNLYESATTSSSLRSYVQAAQTSMPLPSSSPSSRTVTYSTSPSYPFPLSPSNSSTNETNPSLVGP